MKIIRRLPFTLLLITGILLATFLASGPGLKSRPEIVARWGFALHDLGDGTFWSLVTAVFFNHRPYLFPLTIMFALATAGVYEWHAGTRRAAIVFWLGDLGSTALLMLLFVAPLYLARTPMGFDLAYADDVGMSGGGFTCLGAWVGSLPTKWRRIAFALAALYLVADLFIEPYPEGDVLHAIAFPLGVWLGTLFPPYKAVDL